MQKYDWEGFCLTYVEPKHKINEHNQAGANDFQCLIWVFWVCRLSPACYNVDCSQLMSWLDHYQLQLVYQTVEHRPVRNLQHEISLTTSDTLNQSQPLLHITQIYFCVSTVFLPFLKWKVKVPQSCPTICDPVDCSLPGSSVHGIFQAWILEWVLFPSPGDVPNPGIEPRSPALQADSSPSEPPGKSFLEIVKHNMTKCCLFFHLQH